MSEDKISFREKFFFGLNGFPDQMTYQLFQLLVFMYYFAVIGIDLWLMWTAYIIWAIWNAFNDPILGALSDRKKYGKFGKRRFFIVISFIPLCLMMFLLFTVPAGMEFAYFLLIIITFELIYTLFDVNVKSLFPEMWTNDKQRSSVNMVLRVLTIFAILFTNLVPTLFIAKTIPTSSPTDPLEIAQIQSYYITAGIYVAIIVGVIGLLFILFGIKEKEELREQFEKRPKFFDSLKMSFKNKTFLKLVFANMCTWYVLNMLPAMYPLYSAYVFGIEAFWYVGISLMLTFICAAVFMPIHKWMGFKYGMRKGFMITMIVMIFTLIPYLFLSTDSISIILGMVTSSLVGFGISGIMFYFDILMGNIIDQDELKTGVKRSASFYGTNAFIHRFSIVFFISTVAIVFSETSWSGGYIPNPGMDVVIGLRLLMCVFPSIALLIAYFFMRSYDLHGEKLENLKSQLKAR